MDLGCGIVNHVGHGFRYSMSCGDASLQNFHALGLANDDALFVLFMLNCTAAAFDFPCLAEAFLEADGGAVAVLGASRAAFSLPVHNYNRKFFNAVYQQGTEHIGDAYTESRLAYTPNAWFDTPDHYSHLLYAFLGDPEMVLHTCTLGTTAASYPATLGLGLATVAVNVTVGGSRVGPDQYPIDGNDQQLDQVVFDLASLSGVGNRDEYIRQPQFASRLHGIPKKTENYTNQAIVNSPRATR